MFTTLSKTKITTLANSILSSANAFNLDQSNILSFGNEMKLLDEKFSKRVENTVGKREIGHEEQFFLFPQCFQKHLYCRHTHKKKKYRTCLGKG